LILVIVEAATFGLMASLHQGVQIPLGFMVIAQPRILPATIVETLCGLSLVMAALAGFLGWRWAWVATVAAHVFSIGGVALGMAALAAGRGPQTQLNSTYHLTIMLVMLATLALLATPIGRAALRR
jgi:hypothetical protein